MIDMSLATSPEAVTRVRSQAFCDANSRRQIGKIISKDTRAKLSASNAKIDGVNPYLEWQAAKTLGLTKYLSLRTCKKNHTERYTSTGKCVACGIERSARSYDANKKKVNEKAILWRKNNPEKAAQSNRKSMRSEAHIAATLNWRKNNPELVSVHYKNKRAKRRGAEGKHSLKDIRRMFESQNGLCANCEISVANGYHVDHVMPLSKGGSNWPDNLQILCKSCNSRKSNKDPVEWARENRKS